MPESVADLVQALALLRRGYASATLREQLSGVDAQLRHRRNAVNQRLAALQAVARTADTRRPLPPGLEMRIQAAGAELAVLDREIATALAARRRR